MLAHRRLLRLWMLLAIAVLLCSAFAASIRGRSTVADIPEWFRQPSMVADIPEWFRQPSMVANIPEWFRQPSMVADIPEWFRQPV